MKEIDYQPMKTYLGNSQDDSSENNNNLNSNSEENITYSQSDKDELEINTLYKNEPKNENILKDKFILNIDTLQSLRISHSLEKSKNSQSLIDIINGGKYNFDENEYIKLNKENDMNIINKNKNKNDKNTINEKEPKVFNIKKRTHTCNNYKANNIINNNKNNNTSAITKNKILSTKRNISLNNNNNYSAFSLCNNNNNNKTSSFKFKIEEIFKEIFEEKINPKSNNLSKNNDISTKSMHNKNKYGVDKLKPKTLEHQNNINDILNSSSKHLNFINISNEKCKEKSNIKEENKNQENTPVKSNELNISTINDDKQYSIENIDDDNGEEKIDFKFNKNKNNKLKNEPKSELIIGMFGGKIDSSQDEDDKNVMISELDIEISNSIKKNKKLSNEKIKLNNMILEKAIEKNLKKGNFNNCDNSKKINDIKSKKSVVGDRNNFNYNHYTKQKKSSESISKKSSKFNKKIKKKIYPMKKIKSYNNIKNIVSAKNKEDIYYNFDNIIKKCKNNSLSVKHSNYNVNKNITDLKNLSNNSGSNASSFLALNTSITNKNKKNIYKKMTHTAERNKGYKSPYLSKSNPKERKIKEFYKINPYKKINNSLSKELKDIIIKRNKSKILKSLCTTSYNSNNISYKEHLIMNIPNLITANNNKNINTFLKNNTKNKNTYFDCSREYYIPSKINNSYMVRTINNSNNSINNFNNANSMYNYEKNSCKNKKKNDIPICNINKSKIPFKRKIMDCKKTELYSNNTKIKNKINSANSIIYRSNSYQYNNKQNNIYNNQNNSFKYENPLSILLCNNINNNNSISNTIYNSYTNNNNSNSHKNIFTNFKKQIINKTTNYLDNSSLLFNYNTNNDIKSNNNINKLNKQSIINNNNILKIKDNLNLITEINSKNCPYINKVIRTIKSKNEKAKKKLINDKIISKNYIRNAKQKNNLININSFQTNNNNNEQKYKTNNVLLTINNNKWIKSKIKTSYSCRNNNKETMVIEPKHFHKILNNNKIQKNNQFNNNNKKICFNKVDINEYELSL